MADLAHILVVDDDARLRALLKDFLSGEGYRVTSASSAQAARDMMGSLEFDGVVLDVMMPGESGLSFLKALRASAAQVPVLMLSALSEAPDRIAGLSFGSDDYLAKPFEPQELLLRLRNLLKRRPVEEAPVREARFGPFSFNVALGELKRAENVLRLTTAERDMLRALVNAGGAPVSRHDLSQDRDASGTRKVDVQINRLRQKIEADPASPRYLQTVRGQGYALMIEHG